MPPLPKTISSAAKYMTPCLFSATHWYMPASASVSVDTDSTPSSTWILSCEEKGGEVADYCSKREGSFPRDAQLLYLVVICLVFFFPVGQKQFFEGGLHIGNSFVCRQRQQLFLTLLGQNLK